MFRVYCTEGDENGEGERLRILGIETSCDETAAAVVENGRDVLSNALYSQIAIHEEYGGVVPEIASRAHVEKLPYIVPAAVDAAGGMDKVDVIAVTKGPGLVGALLTGLSYAKALAYAAGKPLVGVDHIAGHIAGVLLSHRDLEPPFLCLVVSGGHTELVLVKDYTSFELMGRTRDDAAGEAIDKAARVLGYPYPGGPHLEQAALAGQAGTFSFPRSFRGEKHLDFSFSGPKTALVHLVRDLEAENALEENREHVAASFLASVADALARNTFEAARRAHIEKIALAGGVSANRQLREVFSQKAKADGIELFLPELQYCTDNAAMIASAGYYAYRKWGASALDLNADPGADIESYSEQS